MTILTFFVGVMILKQYKQAIILGRSANFRYGTVSVRYINSEPCRKYSRSKCFIIKFERILSLKSRNAVHKIDCKDYNSTYIEQIRPYLHKIIKKP